MMSRVFVAGAVSYDSIIKLEQFPEPHSQTLFSQTYHEGIGSTGAGKALALHHLALETTFHALVGNDTYGDKIRAYFAEKGIDFLVDSDPAGTERHTNLMDAEGNRISIYTHYATFEPEIDKSAITEAINNADTVVLNIINYCRYLIPLAQEASKPLWIDIHDWDGENSYHQDFVDAADYLFMSSDNMPAYKSFMEKMFESGKKLVVCTHGKEGSSAFNGEWYQLPALPYDLVDSNGAGDNFFAGFLYAHLQGFDTERCLQYATIAGGLCVTSDEISSPDLSPAKIQSEWQKHYG